MTINDLNAIDERVDKKMRIALEKNNKVLISEMAEMLADNNKILIQGLEEYIEKKYETKEIKRQLNNHDKRIQNLETIMEAR